MRPTVLDNYKHHAIGYLIPVVVFGSLAMMIYAIRKGQDKDKIAFVGSALYIVGMLVGAAFALYPVVLPASTNPAYNLTIYNTAAGRHGLTVGFTWWIMGMVLALGYFVFLFRMFRGKCGWKGKATRAPSAFSAAVLRALRDLGFPLTPQEHNRGVRGELPRRRRCIIGSFDPSRLHSWSVIL